MLMLIVASISSAAAPSIRLFHGWELGDVPGFTVETLSSSRPRTPLRSRDLACLKEAFQLVRPYQFSACIP